MCIFGKNLLIIKVTKFFVGLTKDFVSDNQIWFVLYDLVQSNK